MAAAVLTVIATYIGGWAVLQPEGFFTRFPGGSRAWVVTDGPFNEHLVRDVGAFYLAFGAAGALALWETRPGRSEEGRTPELRVLGLGWTVFGALHIGYHAAHLSVLDQADRIPNVVSLGLMLALGVLLLLPTKEVRS